MDKIIMIIFAVVGGGLGIISSIYLVVSAISVIAKKIYGKVRYGKSLYD